jgi:large subunit ribosomal protein L18e
MKSKTQIDKQLKRKTNPETVETLMSAKKKDAWLEVASLISVPKRKRIEMNLSEMDKKSKDGETILIPGKVLSQGNLTKKIKVIAMSFSEGAKEKLLNSKHDFSYIRDEIKKNPDAKGFRILK